MMGVMGWILFGFVVGLVARALTPGRDPMGVAGMTVLGILGALVGGWLGTAWGWYRPNEGASFIGATAGAVILLLAYNFLVRRRVSRKHASEQSRSDRDFPRKAA